MALLKTSQLLSKRLFLTERIFNNVLKQNIPTTKVVEKYIQEIKNVRFDKYSNNVSELLSYPFTTFHKLNKNYLETIISETYNIIKEKGLCRKPNVYNNLIRSYLDKRIDFDIHGVLKDMTDNDIVFNEGLYRSIFMYFSTRGEMKTVEVLLNEIRSKGINLSLKDKFIIASGYIIAGQPEKSEMFIKENNLDKENDFMYFSQCFGYASIGNVTKFKSILGEMKEKNVRLSSKRHFILYYRLIDGNISKSDLEEIIDLTRYNFANCGAQLYYLVANLNSAEHFNYSIFLIEKLIDLIEDAYRFIELFGTSKCPVNIFKQAVTLLGPKCRNISYKRNIFGDIDFDTAFDISQGFSEMENWKIIYFSLMIKAISEKSLPFIEKTLDFSFKNLQWSQVNLLMQQVLLPSMMANRMVTNYDSILDLLPAFSNYIQPVILMNILCSGDFDRYNELISNNKNITKFYAKFDWHYLAFELRNSFTLKEIKRWSMEAEKCFNAQLINSILTQLLINEMIKLSKNESWEEIDQLVGFAKEWNVELSHSNINFLLNAVPQHSEFIRSSILPKFETSSNEPSSTIEKF